MTSPEMSACVFCEIVAGREPATMVREWPDVIAIVPRHPVVTGHVLVIPRRHTANAGTSPALAGEAMTAAACITTELPAASIITSRGGAATQTVGRLHLHVVPRADGDGLTLPWSGRRPGRVSVVHAREPLPAVGVSIFLAGPTPRTGEVPSWRPDAIAELARQWEGQPGELVVLTPESRGGVRARHYDDQVNWEVKARRVADAILYWVPRDMTVLPGMTTNVEFGADVSTGRAVLGASADCPDARRNLYLIRLARRYRTPVRTSLPGTVTGAIEVATRFPVIEG